MKYLKRLYAGATAFAGSLVFALLLTACAAIDALEADESGTRVLVEIATLAAIEQSSDRTETARQVIAAAEDARTWLDFEGVTVDELAAKARERIASSDLELSAKAALAVLVARLEDEVEIGLDTGRLDPAAKVTVNKLLDWIVASALAYAS